MQGYCSVLEITYSTSRKETKNAYPRSDIVASVKLVQNAAKDDNIWDPFDQTAFFIQRHN
jgi:hypothetical protein